MGSEFWREVAQGGLFAFFIFLLLLLVIMNTSLGKSLVGAISIIFFFFDAAYKVPGFFFVLLAFLFTYVALRFIYKAAKIFFPFLPG